MNNCESCVHIDVCRIRNSIFMGITTLKAEDVDITCKHYRADTQEPAVAEEPKRTAPKRVVRRKAK